MQTKHTLEEFRKLVTDGTYTTENGTGVYYDDTKALHVKPFEQRVPTNATHVVWEPK